MIHASELAGRAVVDLDAAEKLGKVDRIVLDPDARRVAGFILTKGSSLFGGGEHLHVAATRVYAIGPDAITVRQAATDTGGDEFEHLPRVSDMVGRKVVSEQGRLLGTVNDVLIDERNGRIIGYTLAAGDLDDRIKKMLASGERGTSRRPAYLRAEANLRAGRDLIVAPEDAVDVDGEPMASDTPVTPVPASTGATAGFETPEWSAPQTPRAERSPWIRSAGGVESLDREGREQ